MADRFFTDDPIDGSQAAPDLLGRQNFAQHLVRLLNTVHEQSPSSVLALIGPWGSGKSSVLGMAVEALKRDHGDSWLTAEFNPWMHSDLESMLAGFFGELRQALPSDVQWNETRKRIGAFGKSISPLAGLTSLIGVDGTGIAKMLSGWISGDTSVSATKKQAEEALRTLNRPILMVLDDLDRLTPQELLMTFKLVRLLGRLPNVYYLLCYDEQTLIDVLGQTDLVGERNQRPQEYLEKIVQVRLDLPPLREAQRDQLMKAGMDAIIAEQKQILAIRSANRFAQAYQIYMKDNLVTPRAINRFFTQVSASLTMVHGEVDFVDFMLITFLRTSKPQAYELLRNSRAKLTGTGQSYASRQMKPEEVIAEWSDQLKSDGVRGEETASFIEFLGVMFAPIDAATRNQNPAPSHYEDILRRRGVGHVDYFDRYFNFGVPDEDIADSVVIAGLELLRKGQGGDTLAKLSAQLKSDTARTVRKIDMYRQQDDAQPLLGLLASSYAVVPNSPGLFAEDPGRSLVSLGRSILTDIEPIRIIPTLQAACREDRQLQFIARIVDPARFAQDETPGWLADARIAVVELIRNRLDQDGDLSSLDSVSEVAFSLVWIWTRIDAPENVKIWLRNQLDSGKWKLIDLIARFATVGTTFSGSAAQTVMSEFRLSDVDELIGLDYTYTQLDEQITAVESEVDAFAVNPTLDDRRDFALKVLREARSRLRTGQPNSQSG